jgi:dynein heavy chain
MVETKDPKLRVVELKEMLRKVIYTMVSRGMFERHKIVFLSQITIRLMSKGMLR